MRFETQGAARGVEREVQDREPTGLGFDDIWRQEASKGDEESKP